MDETWELYIKDLSKRDSFLLMSWNRRFNFMKRSYNKNGIFSGHVHIEYMRMQDGRKTYHKGNLWNIYRRAVKP